MYRTFLSGKNTPRANVARLSRLAFTLTLLAGFFPPPTTLAASAWTAITSMDTARAGHTTTMLLPDGEIFVARGYDGTSYLAAMETYDWGLESWSSATAMNTARAGHTATLLPDGTVLVAGGVQRQRPR